MTRDTRGEDVDHNAKVFTVEVVHYTATLAPLFESGSTVSDLRRILLLAFSPLCLPACGGQGLAAPPAGKLPAAIMGSNILRIDIHGASMLGTIHRDVLGVNEVVARNTAANYTVLGQTYGTLGITGSRWPGGTASQVLSWQDYKPGEMAKACTGDKFGYLSGYPVYPNGDFDAYMRGVVFPYGRSAEMTVNYDTGGWNGSQTSTCKIPGDPTFAAEWVKYANITRRYGIKYWEIGNEEYSSLNDQHTVANGYPNGPATASTYSQNEPKFYTDMKAIDSSINVGIPIVGNPGKFAPWDSYVLSHASYDYVIYHYYPLYLGSQQTDSAVLAAPITGPTSVSSSISVVREELVAAGKCASPCATFPISMSEWNSIPQSYGPQSFSIVEAMYNAEAIGEMFNNGIMRAEHWNSNSCSSNVAGLPAVYSWQTDVGTGGLVTYQMPDRGDGTGGGATTTCAPTQIRESYPFGTILPAGRAFQLYSQSGFATEGAIAVKVDEPSTSVQTYASKRGSAYVVMLINKNSVDSLPVQLAVDGVTGGAAYSTIQYTKAIYDQSASGGPFSGPITTKYGAWQTPLTISLPPWSMTTVALQ
jgi:hypothetical protein